MGGGGERGEGGELVYERGTCDRKNVELSNHDHIESWGIDLNCNAHCVHILPFDSA